jgi:Protein of unknown function (DUF1573)
VYKIMFGIGIIGVAAAIAFAAYDVAMSRTPKSNGSRDANTSSRGSTSSAAVDDRLIVAQEDLDLGTQYENDQFVHRFNVTNTTGEPITVNEWRKTCNCADVSPPAPVTFEPGETKQLTTTFKLRPKKRSDDPSKGELFEVRIYPIIRENDEDVKVAAWEFHCRILPTIHFYPPVLDLGLRSEKEAAIEGSTDVLALSDVRSLECLGSARWDVSVSTLDAKGQVEAPRGSKFRVTVRSKGKLQPEEIREMLTVTAVRENGDKLPIRELMLVGKVVHDVVADPPQIQFRRPDGGGSSTEMISLRSLTEGSFEVRSAASDGERLKIVPVEGSGSGHYALTMGFVQEGKQSTVARFLVRDADGTEYEVEVPVRYYGVKQRLRN